MKILQNYNETIRQTAKYQSYDVGEKYKESPYLIKELQDGKVAIYNCFTREIIIMSEREYSVDFNPGNRSLVSKWYFIPEHWESRTWYESFEKTYRYARKKKSLAGISTYVILPTLGCNANCTYCFQYGEKKKSMSVETADAVAKYIWKTFAGKINLKWFGGEPLVNTPIITRICKALNEMKVNYESMLVTNGLNINQVDMTTMKNLWKVTMAQVTLDGLQEYSSAVKRWKNPTGDEFERVLSNISYLVSNDIRVNIRLNVAKDNEADLLELIDLLHERFSGTEYVSCYPHILFDKLGEEPVEYAETDYEELYRICKAVRSKIVESGLGRFLTNFNVRHSNCMADNLSSVCISPVGSVTVCEHYSDDKEQVIGTVFDGRADQTVLENWQARLRCDMCGDCVIRPLCTKISLCPVGKCTEAERDYTEWQIRQYIDNLCKEVAGQ